MKGKISGIIIIVISLFLIIAVNTFLAPCQGAMEMPCNSSAKAAQMILVLVIIISIGKLFCKDTKVRIFFDLPVIAAAVELLFIPALGRCQMAAMACNMHTFPALTVGAWLLIAVNAVFAIAGLTVERKRKNDDIK